MEELVECFGDAVAVSQDEFTDRRDQYKTRSSKTDQDSRRAEFLERQKSNRQKKLAVLRDLDSSLEEDEKKEGYKSPYKNQLMLSEWLTEVPENFVKEWLYTPVPVGHRALLVARKGKTHSFTKSGYRTKTFQSQLPGGCRTSKSGYTVLDAIWSEAEDCFFVLDILCYKSHHVVDSEAEFRFYWGATKLSEDVDVGERSEGNRYPIIWLPHFPCSELQLPDEDISSLDGYLFYHKEGHYTAGTTPLVGWIKPEMLEDLIAKASSAVKSGS